LTGDSPATAFSVQDAKSFKEKTLAWAAEKETALFLDSSLYESDSYGKYDWIVAAGVQQVASSIADLTGLVDQKKWLFGHLGYDLKNQIEHLASNNPDPVGFPDINFFVPEHVIYSRAGEVSILGDSADLIIQEIQDIVISPASKGTSELKARISRESYLKKARHVQQHIEDGDVYELNFCQEFFAEQAEMDPISVYKRLNEISLAPFSAFYRLEDRFLVSASPERFLAKRGTKLISQPIKGTARRSTDAKEDAQLKQALAADPKEQAENVMIVDLVRNDLHRSCEAGSVTVEELFGIYSFKQVHQMISTITGTLRPDVGPVEAILNAFPMGSMTGAPKIRAMEYIDKLESTKRGLFSGSVGYFDPDGNFDLNVVIRSIFYNAETKYLSYQVGSAITYDSVPEKEYEECLLKAQALQEAITNA
jgi:para-aminobenzoate synthetase component 1